MGPPLEVVAVHVQDVMAILKKLRDHGLAVKRAKCHLLVQHVHLLQNGTSDKPEAMICSLWDLRLRVRIANTHVLRTGLYCVTCST